MKRQRILVTGGTGFTGSHLVHRLLERGYEVVALDKQRGRDYEALKSAGAKIVVGSVTDRELVHQAAEGCGIVHHLAAAFREVNVPKSVYWDVNVNGTRNVFDAAVRNGVKKVVYCSTCGVHGNIKEAPASERAPIAPADYYQETKYEGEKVAHEAMERGLDVTILRPAAIYGPGDPERWLMLFRRVAPGRFFMFGDGQTTYHPLYIDNLIDAFQLAAESDATTGQTYLIADEQYYTLNDLVSVIGEALGVEVSILHLPFWPLWTAALASEALFTPLRIPPPLFRRRVDWFRQNRAFDISKARREMGYEPRIDLPTGVARTAEWYIQQGYLELAPESEASAA